MTDSRELMLCTEAGYYIDEHMPENITLQTLEKHACLSVYHYARTFKQQSGVTPKQFIIDRKLQLAQQLLTETDLKIYEIAEQIGYETCNFTTVFTKRTGMPPTVWRDWVRTVNTDPVSMTAV